MTEPTQRTDVALFKALKDLVVEAQAVADDHHRPRYVRLDQALASARNAMLDYWAATPQPTQAQAGAVPQCWCLTCRPMRLEDPYSIRMALCPTCGNKRCPKANDHRNECTGSNEPGQPGSAYSGGIKGGQHGAE